MFQKPTVYLFFALMIVSSMDSRGETPSFAETICSSYDYIESVSALVRKTTETRGNTIFMLSRVYYQRPDRLHVENISPIPRRIISDGDSFRMFQNGWDKGYAVPLKDLSGEWRMMQQAIPGTAMEHILRLKGMREEILDGTKEHPVRRGYKTDRFFVVLNGDEQDRLVSIEFFKNREKEERLAFYQYDDFVHVTNNCWLATSQRSEVNLEGDALRETRRFSNLQVNQPIAKSMFDHQSFFQDVEFVSDFSKLRQE